MEPPVRGQLRVEGSGQHAPLAHGDRPAVLIARQDLDPLAHVDHDRRADEDAMQRLIAQGRHVQIGLE